MSATAPPRWSGSVRVVWRHEMRLYLATPLTPLFVCAFAVSLAAAIFLVADFYETDDASLRLFRVFLPWVGIVLVPALAMRAWADAPGERGLELTFSLPIPLFAVVAGKFLAGLSVLTLALLATAAFPATLFYLGEPDPGAIAAGYLGALGFLAVAFAVALMAAALVRDVVNAFLLGVGALAVMTLAGWDLAARFAEGAADADILGAIVSLSPKHWLDRVAEGYVEPAAIGYFVAAPLGALIVTTLILRVRGDPGWARRAIALSAGIVIVGAGLAGVRALDRVPGGLDLTADGRFTLDSATRAILRDLPDETRVTLYWSESEPSTPVSIKNYARLVRSRLHLMAGASGGRLEIVEIDPAPDTEAELTALEAGIERIPMTSGAYFYLGATASHGDRTGLLAYADPRRARLLDYDLAQLLQRLGTPRTPVLGLLGPMLKPTEVEAGIPGLGVLGELQQAYDIAVIPQVATELPTGIDVLLVLNAAILRSEMLDAIDAHVREGGGLVVLLDPYMRSHGPSNQVHPAPSEEINDISDLLLGWGVRYLGEDVVGDTASAAPVRGADQAQISYPYWLRLGQDRLSRDHPATSGLRELLLVEAGALTILPGHDAVPLVTTSPESGVRPRRDFASYDPGRLAGEFEPKGGARILAAYLPSGSAGQARPAGDGADTRARGPVFVVADADWIFDPFSVQKVPAGGQVLRRPLNDNTALLLNMVEFATGSAELISIRSGSRGAHPFTRVERMLRVAQMRYRDREAALSARIGRVEALLAEIPEAAGVGNADDLPVPVRARIDELRRDLLPLQHELRDIRREMREDVVSLGRMLTAINLATGPLIVLVLFGCLWSARAYRSI